MKSVVVLTVACLLAGVATVSSAGSARTLAVYKLSERPTHCPADTQAKSGCVELVGKVMSAGRWTHMRRLAAVGATSPRIPAGCLTATTTGTLSGKNASVEFTGAGYYCPKTDTAWYRLRFDPMAAKRFGLPLHGVIRYRGSDNTETFTLPNK